MTNELTAKAATLPS